MFWGFPFMCIAMYGTLRLAISGSMPSSRFPAETSLITSAPAKTASFATFDRKVSTEINASGNSFRMICTAGMTRSTSSWIEIATAPGRVLYPPKSKKNQHLRKASFLPSKECWQNHFPPGSLGKMSQVSNLKSQLFWVYLR